MFETIKSFPQSYRRWFHKQRGDIKELHVEQILNGTTKQPISLEDFRLYLLNKDHTIHNLDFHFWFIDYKKRFNELPEEEMAKSPAPKEGPTASSLNLLLDDFLILQTDVKKTEDSPANNPTRYNTGHQNKYRTTQGQPFRAEVDSVLRTFFHAESFKELNIEPYRSRFILYNGCLSTHPDVFEEVHGHIYNYMNEVTLRRFLHFALQNIRYSVTFFYYGLFLFPALQALMFLFTTYWMHAPRIFRWPVIIISFTSPFFLATGSSGICPFKSHMIHIYELSEYKAWKRGAKATSKYRRSKKVVDVENQTKNENWNKTLEPLVIKYNRRILCHITMFALIVCSITTLLIMSISNEYDAETMANMMKAAADAAAAAAKNTTATTAS